MGPYKKLYKCIVPRKPLGYSPNMQRQGVLIAPVVGLAGRIGALASSSATVVIVVSSASIKSDKSQGRVESQNIRIWSTPTQHLSDYLMTSLPPLQGPSAKI